MHESDGRDEPRARGAGGRVLVTGAAGVLGSAVSSALARRGVTVRGLGRGDAPVSFPGDWKRADLRVSGSLDADLRDVRAVVHAATSPLAPGADAAALEVVLAAALASGRHLVYVGIAGIEDAAAVFAYYDMKLSSERRVAESGVAHTIVRVTQFHPFVDFVFRSLTIGPVLLVPRVRLQPVDVDFAAERIAEYALAEPQGRVPDLHGPERLSGSELATQRAVAENARPLRLPAPPLGPLRALGRLREVTGETGGRTWARWLAEQTARGRAYRR